METFDKPIALYKVVQSFLGRAWSKMAVCPRACAIGSVKVDPLITSAVMAAVDSVVVSTSTWNTAERVVVRLLTSVTPVALTLSVAANRPCCRLRRVIFVNDAAHASMAADSV